MTAYNASLSNSSFNIKSNKQDKNGIYIGFKNGLSLNNEIVNKKSWTIENIDNRTELLSSYLISSLELSNRLRI
ncbi:GmrSD restriction endonuclease domain-containing protein [Psychrobacillus vulpis]|uniref:DUF1524 domain-containing protein n=1 Tax=Psychrobacillus vulpis TaxID=2325572 RepID=A0A544TR48_9BACI|nr:DUF1524 domain-containing protein [Psychrobacillus vulpis]TQR19926.1 DUF1524 domain-containing protein [Psychrobacillus vulpis]